MRTSKALPSLHITVSALRGKVDTAQIKQPSAFFLD